MSDTAPKYTSEQLRRLLSQLRGDFDALRQRGRPIKARLIHLPSNAEAEGVTGYPPPSSAASAYVTAGDRDGKQNFDASGNVKFIDPPVLDVSGQPMVHPQTGQGIDYTMGASRTVELVGPSDAVAGLGSLARRGGKLARRIRNDVLATLAGWTFSSGEGLWWAVVFELAWSGRHPLLSADRQLWLKSADGPFLLLPHDIVQLRQLAELRVRPYHVTIPERWLQRLPDAYVSEIDDAVAACRDLAEVLIEELDAARASGFAESAQGDDAHSPREPESVASLEELDSNKLTDRQRDILLALLRLETFDADSRRTTEAIAKAAEGPHAKPANFKAPLAELARLMLTNSKSGAKGGIWLTDRGCKLAEHILRRRDGAA